jgi:tRNA-specific 2-thiouridylase
VVAYTIAQAKKGNTPNPDVFCNSFVKFGFFLDRVGSSFDKVATGHYAQIISKNGYASLCISPDKIKDQTYFLSYLKQNQLSKVLFPVGGYTKVQVRALAHTFDLANKERKDSQGICFLGTIKFRDFLKHHLGSAKGRFIEQETGDIVGFHDGAWFYTIGQRQGIRLGGGPWYVVAKDIATHEVFISRNYARLNCEKQRFLVTDCNWVRDIPEDSRYALKLRHGPVCHAGFLKRIGEDRFQVVLDQEDQGIAPGQFAVFYKENECIGAGIIELIQ